MNHELGTCPTGQHITDIRQCGFAGCMDLRVWAKSNRYRYRLDESYKVESNSHVKGDGRWFVEILCKNGLIYPDGGLRLLVYSKSGAASEIAKLGADIALHQSDGRARVFKFPAERLNDVAAILKPRKRRPPVILSPERLHALQEGRKRIAQVRQTQL